MESEVMDTLRGHFRPEFLNRVDEIIIFHSLCPPPRDAGFSWVRAAKSLPSLWITV
jgi:hypothetical protein